MTVKHAGAEIIAAVRDLPVNVVDGWSTFGTVGGLIDITFNTQVFMPDDPHVYAVPVARLRFNQHFAKMLRDALDAQLNPPPPPPKGEVN